MNIFCEQQINLMRASYGKLETISSDKLKHFHDIWDKCTDAQIAQLAGAEIKFVSKLAANEVLRRKMRRQEDYRASMQSTLDFCV